MNSAKQQDTKLISRSWQHFYTPVINSQKQKLRKQSIYYCNNKKNKVLRNKLNQGGKRLVLRKLQDIKKKIEEDINEWKNNRVHGLGKSTSIKCPYYAKQAIDSMQSLLKYQQHISQTQSKLSKNSSGIKKTPNSHSNPDKED